jgi:hypothetical protein
MAPFLRFASPAKHLKEESYVIGRVFLGGHPCYHIREQSSLAANAQTAAANRIRLAYPCGRWRNLLTSPHSLHPLERQLVPFL